MLFRSTKAVVLLIAAGFSLAFMSSAAVLFQEDFNTDSNGWMLSTIGGGNSWKWYSDQGVSGSGGLRCKVASSGNYVISPAYTLNAGTQYSLVYSGKKNTNGSRTVQASFDTAPALGGSNTEIGSDVLSNDGQWEDYVNNFSVPATGDYHILLEAIGTGYIFTYLDDFLIEETIFPTIDWVSPAANAILDEGTDVNIQVNAADADGYIQKVEHYIDNVLVSTETSSPFTYTWEGVTPGTYELKAIAYDNRGWTAETSVRTVTVETPPGFVDVTEYNFDTQSEYWKYFGGWKTSGSGYQGSTAAFGFNLITDDYLASPALQLFAGETYTLRFRNDCQGSNREITAAVNTEQSLSGKTDLLTVPANGDDDYLTLHEVDFTIPADGTYHLIFYSSTGSGYRKILIDEISLTGTHNQGALSKLNYNTTHATTTLAEGAVFTFNADVTDNDGSVLQTEFQVDGQTVATDVGATAPYTGVWNGASIGTHQLTARVTDIDNFAASSFPLEVNVVENNWNSSFLGGAGEDEIRGAVIQNDGTIVLAANLTSVPGGVSPQYLNGTSAGQQGMIIRISPNGQTVLSVTVVGDLVVDLSKDSFDRLYVAAGNFGFLRLNPSADNVDFAYTYGLNVHRVDAAQDGHSVILLDDETDYDEVKLLNAEVRIFDSSGTEIGLTSGATTFTTDVCIDGTTQTAVSIGYKNMFTNDGDGNFNFPVDVPAYKGTDYSGTQKYKGYNWSSDETSPNWLNLPENNMADARGARCEMGQDGQLYIVFEVDGGNHLFRYDPFSITTPNPIVGGDAYSEFYNTNTEPKVVVGRYNPATGAIMKTQQFCARLTSTAGNTVRTKNGNIAANAAGEVYIVGQSAWGIPITLEYLPGEYLGGGFVLKLSQDFSERQLVTRLTNGAARAVALGPLDGFLYAGDTQNQLFTNNPIQAGNAGGKDAWFAVEEATPTVVLPVEWEDFRAEKRDKESVFLEWETSTEMQNQGFIAERRARDGNWTEISNLIPASLSRFYTYLDNKLPTVKSELLYRIAQYDMDGTVSYSPVKSVWFDGVGKPLGLFPNPTTNRLFVNTSNRIENIRIVDSRGMVMKELRELPTGRSELLLNGFPNGLYRLNYSIGGKEFSESFLIGK